MRFRSLFLPTLFSALTALPAAAQPFVSLTGTWSNLERAGAPTALPGDTVELSFEVRNRSEIVATSSQTQLAIALPGLPVAAVHVSQGSVQLESPDLVTIDLRSVAPGAAAEVSLRLDLPAPLLGPEPVIRGVVDGPDFPRRDMTPLVLPLHPRPIPHLQVTESLRIDKDADGLLDVGDTSSFLVEVSNLGRSSLAGTLVLPEGSGFSFPEAVSVSVPPGDTQQHVFEVALDLAPPEPSLSWPLPFLLKADGMDALAEDLEVDVDFDPRIEAVWAVHPSQLIPGQLAKARLDLRNTSREPATGLSVELPSTDHLELQSGVSTIDVLEPGALVSVHVDLVSAAFLPLGHSDVHVEARLSSSSSDVVWASRAPSFEASWSAAERVRLVSSTVPEWSDRLTARVDLTLRNDGTRAAPEGSLQLTLPVGLRLRGPGWDCRDSRCVRPVPSVGADALELAFSLRADLDALESPPRNLSVVYESEGTKPRRHRIPLPPLPLPAEAELEVGTLDLPRGGSSSRTLFVRNRGAKPARGVVLLVYYPQAHAPLFSEARADCPRTPPEWVSTDPSEAVCLIYPGDLQPLETLEVPVRLEGAPPAATVPLLVQALREDGVDHDLQDNFVASYLGPQPPAFDVDVEHLVEPRIDGLFSHRFLLQNQGAEVAYLSLSSPGPVQPGSATTDLGVVSIGQEPHDTDLRVDLPALKETLEIHVISPQEDLPFTMAGVGAPVS